MSDTKELKIGRGDEILYYAKDMDAPGALEGFFDVLREIVIKENIEEGMSPEEAEASYKFLLAMTIANLKKKKK